MCPRLFKKIRQVIRQENEFYRMRAELMDRYTESFVQSCDENLKSSYEQLRAELLSGDSSRYQSLLEEGKADLTRMQNAAQLKIEQITSMSDGDVKQLYYKTFGRWHPSGY